MDTITNLQFRSLGIPLDDKDIMTNYYNALRRVAVDIVRVKVLELQGMELQEVIANMDAVKTLRPNFTPETPYEHYLELMK